MCWIFLFLKIENDHEWMEWILNFCVFFFKVARCISQLNVQMSRLTCGPRSRSNSFSPSPSRSPSLKSYLSTSASPRSGHSPIISTVSKLKPKEISPRKRTKRLVRSLTLPSAENTLPIKVLFASSSESEDKISESKVPEMRPKFKSQMSDSHTKLSSSSSSLSIRASSSTTHGRTDPSVNRAESLRVLQRRVLDSTLKGARPKHNLSVQVTSAFTYWLGHWNDVRFIFLAI